MSKAIQREALELLWRQWTAVGVAGVAKPPQQAIDLEALISFTPYVASVDPRLGDESTDWCARIGKTFISISRLRQLLRWMPPRSQSAAMDLPSSLIAKLDFADQRLSGKSRPPSLELPSLVQLRSRYIFGVGARADVLARLVMRERVAGAQRAATISPSGYTKQATAKVLDELAQAGVLVRLVRGRAVSYELAKDAALRSLLAPLPRRMPRWAERFVVVATILETWRRFGARATYVVELAKALDRIKPIIAAAGEVAPVTGRPRELLARIERWAINLLDDNVWEDAWMFDDQDLSHDILVALYDDVVEVVQSDAYPAGYTELEDVCFKNVDREDGTSEFTVQFTAEHPTGGFDFVGYVEGSFRFDPDAEDKEDFLDSVELAGAQAHFDMGNPDE